MYNSIQYVRAIAAIMVVLYHETNVMNPYSAAKILHIGAYGVDLFFIVSGFIMVVTTNRRETDPVMFIRKRINRIVPMYWLATFCIFGLLLVYPTIFNSTILDIKSLVLSMFFIPHFHPNLSDKIWPLLIQGWTLNYEMLFYSVFAVALAISHRYRVALVSGAFIFLVLFGFIFEPKSAIGITITSGLTMEFVMGALIGVVVVERPVALGWAVAALMAINVILQPILLAENIFSRPVSVGLLAAFMVITLLWIESRYRIFTNKIVLYIADASYSIYLFHVFGLGGVRFLIAKFQIDVSTPINDAVSIFFGFVCSVMLGIVVYEFIEKPIIRYQLLGNYKISILKTKR